MRAQWFLGGLVALGLVVGAWAGWSSRVVQSTVNASGLTWTNIGLPVSVGAVVVRGGSGAANTVSVFAVQNAVTSQVGSASATDGVARLDLDKDRVRLYTSDKLVIQWVVTTAVTVLMDPYVGE